MTDSENPVVATPSNGEAQWTELTSRIAQLEAEKSLMQQETKALRQLLERLISHRQTSHNELVILLTTLVSKLPMNDVGGLVARLVEHNSNVNQYLSALIKGTADMVELEQPTVMKTFEQAKRDLSSGIKPLVEELIRLNTPLEKETLENLAANPGEFFTPKVIRATRCFLKGQVPRERIVRQFGEQALNFFVDLTTDPKLNPRPKQDEIVMAFRNDFESAFAAHPDFLPDKRDALMELYTRVQRSKANTEEAHLQKNVFQRLSFIIELLHYYQNQNSETPEVIFAQRLPALIEQIVTAGPQDKLDDRLLQQAEALLAYIVNPDHRHMVINNTGKTSDTGRTLKYVLKLRAEKVPDVDSVISDFLKHLIPTASQKAPAPEALLPILKMLHPEMQRLTVRALMFTDRLRKTEAEDLARQLGEKLGLKQTDFQKPKEDISPEVERQLAWAKVRDLIARRSDPRAVAAAIRDRLSAKYDGEEIRESWVALTEADPMSLIRVFSQLPYGQDGKTESIARPVMETYVSRLTHEKYASTYHKVVTSLRNMFHAKPDSPTLTNFTALVRWVNPEAADKMCAEIGMPVHA